MSDPEMVTLSPLGYPRRTDPETERRMRMGEARMPHVFHRNERRQEGALVRSLSEPGRRRYFARILQHWREERAGEWARYG